MLFPVDGLMHCSDFFRVECIDSRVSESTNEII